MHNLGEGGGVGGRPAVCEKTRLSGKDVVKASDNRVCYTKFSFSEENFGSLLETLIFNGHFN